MAITTRVAHQGPTQGARDAGSEFQAGQSHVEGLLDEPVKGKARAGAYGIPRLVQVFRIYMQDQAPEAVIIGQYIAAATQDEKGDLAVLGQGLEPKGLFGVTYRAHQSGWAAHLQGGQGFQGNRPLDLSP
jgi:hypothetical protein